jgi:hypothetical protein
VTPGGPSSPEAILRAKYERLGPLTRNAVEREVLDVAYRGLLDGRRRGLWMDVNLEDLMAHARQESGGVIDALARGEDISHFHSVGTTVWNFHQLSEVNVTSFGVWQTGAPNVLWLGKDISPKLADLHLRYVDRYRLTEDEAKTIGASCAAYVPERGEKDAWSFLKKIAIMEAPNGPERAKAVNEELVRELGAVLAGEPELHAKVVAALLEKNYQRGGVRSPNAVRATLWPAIQTNLDPKMWLMPVRFDDDRPPSPEGGCLDNNRARRGDYGKQVVLGSSYNDRGMVYWYAATGDQAALDGIARAWASDPARLVPGDYATLRGLGYLRYLTAATVPGSPSAPAIYEQVVARLGGGRGGT